MKEEVKYLETVKGIVKENISKLDKVIKLGKETIIKSKKFLYEHKNEIKDTDLTSDMNEEDFKVDLINQYIDKKNKLSNAYLNPYFGRVDFNNDKIYVGITDVAKNYKEYVYDWRSDIASIYYDENFGKHKYKLGETFVEGNVGLRRIYRIKMGKLESFIDNNIAINDEYLQEVLDKNSTDKMKNIVTTIQKKQNEIIRYGGNIIVEGTSGSGKTSIAMHKIAYSLYNSNLTNKNILIITPSKDFTKYIASVLPSLNEDNVRMVTYKKFINKYLDNTGRSLEETYDNLDITLYDNQISVDYKKKIDNYLKEYKQSLRFNKSLGLNKTIISSDKLNKYLTKDLSISNLIDYICEKICDEFNIDYDRNYDKLNKKVRSLLNIPLKAIDLYNEFLVSINKEKLEELEYFHVWAALYIYFEINGYPHLSYIKEVFIDEVQDYNIFELELIKRIFNTSKFTLLGDVNQSINPFYRYDSLERLNKLFDAKYVYLNKSYRSSKSIVEFSNKILGLTNVVPVRKFTKDIIRRDITDIDRLNALIEDLKKLSSSIAIITKSKEEANQLKDKVKVPVLSVIKAKGLEFDTVIVYTGIDDYFNEEEKNLYYIAVTRALHTLVLINQKSMQIN